MVPAARIGAFRESCVFEGCDRAFCIQYFAFAASLLPESIRHCSEVVLERRIWPKPSISERTPPEARRLTKSVATFQVATYMFDMIM